MIRNLRIKGDAQNALIGVPLKLITLTDQQQDMLKTIPYVFGEPVFSDYTFGPALTWVFEFKSLTFTVYTDLDGNWNLDVQRIAHWSKVDEFLTELEEILNTES